jgi:hypothetical protein
MGQKWHMLCSYCRSVLRGNCLGAVHAEQVRDAVRKAVLREAMITIMFEQCEEGEGQAQAICAHA